MLMNNRLTAGCLLLASLLAACTYDTIRMAERQQCAAMPDSQRGDCYQRTEMTKAQYDARRRELKRAQNADPAKPADPRYQDWLP